jgi:hypothetical protein
MNHQSNHDEIQIVNAELLQSRSNSIPPISSLISNIQTIPLSVDYNSNTINPSLIDFSLLDQSQHQDHQEPDQEIINEDDSALSDDLVVINQTSSSSSATSIPSISSLINAIQPTQLTNDYSINQINPTFTDYENIYPIGDNALSDDFSLSKKLERNSLHVSTKTNKIVTSIQNISPQNTGSINTDFNLSNTGKSVALKKVKKVHQIHANDFNSEKFESLANLNSTLDLLVAVSCQINERNQLKKDTKPIQLENNSVDTKFLDNVQSVLVHDNQIEGEVCNDKNKAKLQRAKSLPQSAIDIMIEYFDAHSDHPYPSIEDRRKMSVEGIERCHNLNIFNFICIIETFENIFGSRNGIGTQNKFFS